MLVSFSNEDPNGGAHRPRPRLGARGARPRGPAAAVAGGLLRPRVRPTPRGLDLTTLQYSLTFCYEKKKLILIGQRFSLHVAKDASLVGKCRLTNQIRNSDASLHCNCRRTQLLTDIFLLVGGATLPRSRWIWTESRTRSLRAGWEPDATRLR